MNKTSSILLVLITNIVWANAVTEKNQYPYFSDPKKQIQFERQRIYVYEESGQHVLTSGGGASVQLANPLQVILLGESAQYLSVPEPTISTIDYWYNFDIKQNNLSLTEIDFLNVIGLQSEAKQIVDDYKNKLDGYYHQRNLSQLKSKHLVDVKRGWLGGMLTKNTYDLTTSSEWSAPHRNFDPGNTLTFWSTVCLTATSIAAYMTVKDHWYDAREFYEAHGTLVQGGYRLNQYDKSYRNYTLSLNLTILSAGVYLSNLWKKNKAVHYTQWSHPCLLYTSPSPRDRG